MFHRHQTVALTALGLAATLWLAPHPASAQIQSLSDFQEDVLNQTGPTTTQDVGWFFNSRLATTSAGDVASGTLDYPGPGSPVAYGQADPTLLEFGSSFFASQADLLTAYPFGTYTASYTGGTLGDGSVSIDYENTFFPNVPVFTADTFNGAPGLNADQPFTFSWNAFTGQTNDAFVFFSVTDTTTNTGVFNGSFLDPNTLSQTVAGGTFTNGDTYIATIDFSSRIDGASNGVGTFQGFDRLTQMTFTAAPEPSETAALGLGVLGVGGLILKTRRRRAQAS